MAHGITLLACTRRLVQRSMQSHWRVDIKLYMTYVSNEQLNTEMSKQLSTMLIISHKHYINSKRRDSTLLLCSLYDIREALYFINMSSAFSAFSRVDAQIEICWNLASYPAAKSKRIWKYDWILVRAWSNIWCNSIREQCSRMLLPMTSPSVNFHI